MTRNWAHRELGDVLEFASGKSIKPRQEGEFPAFGSNGLIGRSITSLYDRGIIIGRVGAYCGSIALSTSPFWASDNTIVAQPRNDLDLRFAYYLLTNARLNRHAGGAAQPLLTQATLKPLRFPIPPLHIQTRIASTLGAYDDLIDLNRRRIALLEEMARRLFEEWFVRFRFPGYESYTIKETPDGPLPGGWRYEALGSLCDEVRESVSPSEVTIETPYVGLEHIPRRSTTLNDWGSPKTVTSTKLRFCMGDVLFGKIRPYFHKVVFAPFDGVCSSDAIVVRSRAQKLVGLVLSVASSDRFVAKAVATSNGTKMPRANWAVLSRTPVLLPPDALLNTFNQSVVSAAQLAALLNRANTQLAASRDLLLPRLISGELSVAVAERELEAVA